MNYEEIQNYIDLIYQMNFFKQEKTMIFDDDNLESIYVLKIENKIVSTARLLIEKKLYQPIGHIEDVVTDEKYRSNGYGKILINYLKYIAFNNFNCYKIVLNCKPTLEKFYTSCGMKKTGYSFSLYKNH
jgi:predicted GNAT family N-acyltransferase